MDDVGSHRGNGLVSRAFLALTIFLLAGAAFATTAQSKPSPGSLDHGFGTGGRTITAFPLAPDAGVAQDMVKLPDGSVYVLGFSGRDMVLTRLHPDGSVDESFGRRGYAPGAFGENDRPLVGTVLALQSDGKIIVGGSSSPFGRGLFARYQTDGSLDRSFATNGLAEVDTQVGMLAVDSEDRIVTAGSSGYITQVARFGPDGSPDSTFASGGLRNVRFGGASGLYELSLGDERITITGRAGTLRLNPDGTNDAGFGEGGIVPNGGQAMLVQPDGKIVLANDGSISRLLNEGSPDPAFGNAGTTGGFFATLNDLALDSSGRIIAGGSISVGNPLTDFLVWRLTADGTPDPAFGNSGVKVTDMTSGAVDSIAAVDTYPDGSILAAGSVQPPFGAPGLLGMARYTDTGLPDPQLGDGSGQSTFRPLLPSKDAVFDTARLKDGRIVAVGRSNLQAAIAVYGSDGKSDPAFGEGGILNPTFTNSSFGEIAEAVLPQKDGKFLICVSSTSGSTLVRYRGSGAVDPSFGDGGTITLDPMDRCHSVLRDREGRLVIAGIDLDNYTHLARLTADGQIDGDYGESGFATGPRFSPSGGGVRRLDAAIAPNGDAVVAGDRFGATVYRVDSTGTLRQSFGEAGVLKLRGWRGEPFLGRAEVVRIAPGGRIVVAGVSRKQMAYVVLDHHGDAIRSVGKRGLVRREVLGNSEIDDLRVLRDGRIVTAGTGRTGCESFAFECDFQTVVGRFLMNGRPDTTFGKKGMVIRRFGLRSRAASLLVGKDGYTVAGKAETRTDRDDFLLTRLRR